MIMSRFSIHREAQNGLIACVEGTDRKNLNKYNGNLIKFHPKFVPSCMSTEHSVPKTSDQTTTSTGLS